MELIRDIYRSKAETGRPVISFEFFPTKTEEGEIAFFDKTVPALAGLKPDYCSVTYGAGGSTRDKTLRIVSRIQNDFSIPTMAHLTCVNATRNDIVDFLNEARSLDINNILALRGDPPAGQDQFVKTEGGFEYSYELVELLNDIGDYSVATAGFPEGHIDCKEGKQTDWGYLKRKIDCGADFVITQLFFDNQDFFEFRDHMTKKLGVEIPIVPGILPVLNAQQIERFTALCGAKIPATMKSRLAELADDNAAATEFGIEYATSQIEELLKEGAPGVHLYTLNKAYSPTKILKNLALA